MPIKYQAIDSLMEAGITKEDAYALRRISMTLHGWFEHECNGTIQREEESGLPYWYSSATYKRLCRAIDRESGAMK
ncbi:MAG: hypothetical protein KGI54_14540 [Pseudomonadota bacterium]|nr:hypothetical protein [Pseudomonadota bacterium]